MSLESDLSGYTQLIWHEILRWPADEFEVFMMKVRQELKDKKLHPYFHVRYVWGRKPEAAESADAAPTA
jgi:cephalosporin-C deacetylase-like acetyl esterase